MKRAVKAVVASAVALATAGSASWAANITNLDTGSALVNATDTAGQTSTGGFDNSVSVNLTTGTTGSAKNGLTFNVTFTPAAADLAAAPNTNSSANTRLLAELGGNGNGAGLFLVNGVPTFVAKVGGVAGDVPSASNDGTLSPAAGGVTNTSITNRYAGGVNLVAGTTYTLVATLALTSGSTPTVVSQGLYLDTSNTGSSVTGGPVAVVDTRTNYANTTNYVGNNTVSVRTKSNSPAAGGVVGTAAIAQIGGSDTLSGDTFYSGVTQADGIQSFAGTIQTGLLFNAVGTIQAVPEPSMLGLAAVAGSGVLRRRRR